MSEYKISAETRTVIGKKVKTLRKADIIPGNIYGGKGDPISVQFVGMELRSVLRKGALREQITVDVNGSSETVVIKELQRHLTRGDLIHIDLIRV